MASKAPLAMPPWRPFPSIASHRVRSTVRRFHRLYYDNSGRTWTNTRWLGVPVLKCPLDLWIYQELIAQIRPDLVIECGTFQGGSALFLASCMDLVDHGRVVTVDVAHYENLPVHPRITYLVGSSLDEEIVARVRTEAEPASSVFLILDSNHTRAHVLAELELYAPLVTLGSYLVVEDTNINGHPVSLRAGPGPYEAVEEFLRRDGRFVRDTACEKFFLTFQPGGYLRRVS
jgi:cephalosporin hydroxylase